VVRAVEHVGAIVDRHPRIVGVLNAFHRNWKLGLGSDPLQIFPGHRVGEDLSVMRQSGGRVLARRLGEMLGKVLVGVVGRVLN
jgi:hypothetical protein